MKYPILLFLIFFSCFSIYAQEVVLNSTVVATAGNLKNASVASTVNISKWRLGEVHLIQLQNQPQIIEADINWTVKPYPNPFEQELNLGFTTEKKGVFTILLSDILGNEITRISERTVLPNETVKMELAQLSSAIYLIHIIPKNGTVQKVMKIQKH